MEWISSAFWYAPLCGLRRLRSKPSTSHQYIRPKLSLARLRRNHFGMPFAHIIEIFRARHSPFRPLPKSAAEITIPIARRPRSIWVISVVRSRRFRLPARLAHTDRRDPRMVASLPAGRTQNLPDHERHCRPEAHPDADLHHRRSRE